MTRGGDNYRGGAGKTAVPDKEQGAREAPGENAIEKALRECESGRARTQALMHVGNWKMDLETRTGSGSDEFFRILGIPRPEVFTYEDFDRRVHPDDRKITDAAVAEAAKKRERVAVEFRVVRPDGTVRYVSSEGEFTIEADRQILFGTFQDITERRGMEEALRESEKSFIDTFEASPAPTVICRREDEQYLAVNLAFEKATGYRRAEALGKTTDELGLTAEPGLIPRLLKEIEKGGIVYNRQITFRGKSKTDIVGLSSIIPFTFHRQPCYLFVGVDISDLNKAEEALRESEKSFFNAFEASPAVTVISSLKDGRLLEVNKAFMAASGYARGEVIGKTSEELGLFPQHILRAELLREVGRKGGVYNREMVFAGKNKREVIGLTSIIPFTFHQQPCLLFVGIDITERKKAEDTLRRNEYELRTVVENSPDIFFRLDRQQRYVYVNPTYERITGIASEQFLGRTNDELKMPPRLAGTWRSAAREVLASGREVSVEFELTGFFGTRYFIARLIPEFEKTGLVGTVLVIARDITDRKRVEEKIASLKK